MADTGFTLPIGHRITFPGHFDVPVTLEDARPVGNRYECRVRLPNGTLDEAVIFADEARALADIDRAPTSAVKPVGAENMRLLIESARIRLAYAYDQQFAVRLSGIRTLPHQVEAVYERLLPQPRLRFLLADDPGAGKTIMADPHERKRPRRTSGSRPRSAWRPTRPAKVSTFSSATS